MVCKDGCEHIDSNPIAVSGGTRITSQGTAELLLEDGLVQRALDKIKIIKSIHVFKKFLSTAEGLFFCCLTITKVAQGVFVVELELELTINTRPCCEGLDTTF